MSYILDALRRADRERRQGQAPDAALPPVGTPPPAPGPRLSIPRIWARVEFVAMAGLAAAGFWWWLNQPADAPPAKATASVPAAPTGPTSTTSTTSTTTATTAPAPAASSLGPAPMPATVPSGTPFMAPSPSPAVPPSTSEAAVAAAPLQQAVQQPLQPKVQPTLQPALQPPLQTAPSPTAPGVPAGATPAQSAPPFLARTAPPATPPRPLATKPDTPQAAAKAPTAPSAPAAAVALADLPADVRQQVPALKLGGSIHSPNRADRLLIVDGQVAHEGDVVAPGVVLELIQPRSAVFRFRQYRYELRF